MFLEDLLEKINKYQYKPELVLEGAYFNAPKKDLSNIAFFANETEEVEISSDDHSSVEDDKAMIPQPKGLFAKIKDFFTRNSGPAPQSFTMGRNQTTEISGEMPSSSGNPVGKAIAKLGNNITKAINSIKEKSNAVNPPNPNRVNAYVVGKDNLPTVSAKQHEPYEQSEFASEKGAENQVIVPKEVPSGKIQDVSGPVIRPEGISERAMRELDGIELGNIKVANAREVTQDDKSEKPEQKVSSEPPKKDLEESQTEPER